jgi:hypothetical protein
MGLAETQFVDAATRHAQGDGTAATRTAAELTNGRFGVYARWVDAAADELAHTAVRSAAQLGWLPVDLYQVARRRIQDFAAHYVVDAAAAVSGEYATHHPRWHEQLDELDAHRWWSPDRPHLAQWAMRHGCDRITALKMVIEVLALLMVLPRLQQGPSAATEPSSHVDEKILARVRALLAKAESTEFPEEAELLTAKAQELMSRHSLHQALLDHDRGAQHRPGVRRVWLDSPYVSAKALLVDAVAEANRCRAVFSDHLGFVTVIGHEIDLDIVELLATSLLVQATSAMTAAGRQVNRHGRMSRTRSFRQSFLVAYAGRIRERLNAAAEGQVAATDDSRLLPVLADRSRAVNDAFAAMFPNLVSKAVSANNAAGWGAGRAAADLALLDVFEAVGAAQESA